MSASVREKKRSKCNTVNTDCVMCNVYVCAQMKESKEKIHKSRKFVIYQRHVDEQHYFEGDYLFFLLIRLIEVN